jgi:hypothetical protein
MSTYCFLPGLATGNNNGADWDNAWKTFSSFSSASGQTIQPGDTILVSNENGMISSTSSIGTMATWSGSTAGMVKVIVVKSDHTTPGFLILNGAGSGATIDGILINGRTSIHIEGFIFLSWGRDGIRGTGTASTNLTFNRCMFISNTNIGLNCAASGGTFGGSTLVSNCFFASNGTGDTNTTDGVRFKRNWHDIRSGTTKLGYGVTFTSTNRTCIQESVFRHKVTGVVLGTSSTFQEVKNSIIDNCTTGVSQGATANKHSLNMVRFTNNTTGASTSNGATLQFRMCAWYNNTTKISLGTTSVADIELDTDMAGTGYITHPDIAMTANADSGQKVISVSEGHGFVAGDYIHIDDTGGAEEYQIIDSVTSTSVTVYLDLLRNYTTANSAFIRRINFALSNTAEARWVNYPIGCCNVGQALTAGINQTPDFPAIGNVRESDTSDLATGTLLSNKILKSNTTGNGAGNYNDDNLSVENIRPVAFGLSQTGTLANLVATDAAYVSLEEGRNSDQGTVAGDIMTGKSVLIRNVQIDGSMAIDYPDLGNVRDTDSAGGSPGTLSSNKILKSNTTGSGAGNYNDDNLSVGNIRPVSFGLSQIGTLANLVATDSAYVTLENSRNNDNGTVAGDILVTKTIKIKNVSTSGTFDESVRNIGLPSNKILLGNTIKIQNVTTSGSAIEETHTSSQVLSSAGGTWNDSNLSNGKIAQGTQWGLSYTGTRTDAVNTNVLTTNGTYGDPNNPITPLFNKSESELAFEDSRNFGASNSIIVSGQSITQKSIQYNGTASGEMHTQDQVISTAGGNYKVSNLTPQNVRIGLTFGLSGEGLLVEETHTPNDIISTAGGNYLISNLTPQNVRLSKEFGLSQEGLLVEETHTPEDVISTAGGNYLVTNLISSNVRDGIDFGITGLGSLIAESHSLDEVISTAGGNWNIGELNEGTIAEGINFAIDRTGERTDANPSNVLIENGSYGNPSAPITPTFNKLDFESSRNSTLTSSIIKLNEIVLNKSISITGSYGAEPIATTIITNISPVLHDLLSSSVIVSIEGLEFNGVDYLEVNGVLTEIIYQDDTLIQFYATDESTETVKDIVLYDSSDNILASFDNAMIYKNLMRITGLKPIGGLVAGGDSVTISGEYFGNTEGTLEISHDNKLTWIPIDVNTWSNTIITFTSPEAPAGGGGAAIRITKGNGIRLIIDYGFQYYEQENTIPVPGKAHITSVVSYSATINKVFFDFVPLVEWYDIYKDDVKINISAVDNLYYMDNDVDSTVTYNYRVAAVNRSGSGELSDIYTIKTLVDNSKANAIKVNESLINEDNEITRL